MKAIDRQRMKVAVITPYFKEPTEKLQRCIASVAAQDYPVVHYMVADGFPNESVARAPVKHIILPEPHGDYGNTPRGLGAISALNSGFEAFAFLDADNWFAPNHVSSLVGTVRRTGAHVAYSGRKIVLPDGTQVDGRDPEDAAGVHVDTSAFFITSKAAFLLSYWAMMDPATAAICDRVMLAAIQATKTPIACSGLDTLYYESNYSVHYSMAGKPIPAAVHDVNVDAIFAKQSRERMLERMRMFFIVGRRS